MKPELRAQLAAAYRVVEGLPIRVPASARRQANTPVGGHWTPSTFVTFVDVYKDGWGNDEYNTFFQENFVAEHYDVIECRSDQLEYVNKLCDSSDYPEVLIIHVQNPSKVLTLPTQDVPFFVLKSLGDKTISVEARPRADGSLIIYHPGSGLRVGDDVISGIKVGQYERPPSGFFAVDGVFGGKVRPSGTSAEAFPNAVIAHLAIGDSAPGKEKYTVSDRNSHQGQAAFASLVSASETVSNGVAGDAHFKVSDTGPRKHGLHLVVHGRPRRFDIEFSGAIRVLFPDMSDAEVATVWKNKQMFIGNDRDDYGSDSTVANYVRRYFVERKTISQIVLEEDAAMERVKAHKESTGAILESTLEAIDSRLRNALSLICYAESYFDSLVFKTHYRSADGFNLFDAMISKFATTMTRGGDALLATIGPFTRSILALVQDRVLRESKLDVLRRRFLLERSDELVNARKAHLPYLSERAVANPVLEQEQAQRELMGDYVGFNPVVRERMHFEIPPKNGYYHFKKKDYIVLYGIGYQCAVHDCGFVVATGRGRIRVSGSLHSLVAARGVEVVLDNVSPMSFDPELYLYTNSGSIFDSIINYEDKLSRDRAMSLIPQSSPEKVDKIEDHEKRCTDEDEEKALWRRSVIRNLYCWERPRTWRSAEILNIINM